MTPSKMLSVDLETLRRFDRPGPRYTSYPTAVEFHDGVGPAEYRELLAQLPDDAPVCLYAHLPFCRERCTFCACHVVATPHQPVAANYLDYLLREIDLVAAALGSRRRALQLHWGGGTPTYFQPQQLTRLFEHLTSRFELDLDPQDGAEIALEADPRVTTAEHLETLAGLGFNRLSLGVQDFTPAVQDAIGRHQTFAQTRELMTRARSLGFDGGLNIDLVYGLPRQTEDSFRANLRQVLELRPDRVAAYSFAYVPWLKVNQRRIEKDELPPPDVKLRLYLAALETFLEAGYEPIGMDHFALPDDELAVAAREGRLERNFMGYTVKPSSITLAFGLSAIGDLGGGYVQNAKKLSTYYQALDRDELPVERGRLLEGDDALRRWVITRLLCGFEVDKHEVTRRFAVDFDDYFGDARSSLGDLRGEGMVEEDGDRLRIVGAGKLFVRNAAMAFDRYLNQPAEKPVFSRTV